LPQPRNSIEQVSLHAMREDVKSREYETRLAATTAQYELADLARMSVARELPPLTTDAPFVGPYKTNFQAIFASRSPSSTATRLDRSIPILYDLVQSRAQSATVAFEAMQEMEKSYSGGQTPLIDVLKAFERLNRQRI